jgi:hypothetical protein
MRTLNQSPYRLPTQQEIEAAVRRAHLERSRAVARFFATLFRRRKPHAAGEGEQPTLAAPAWR